MTSSGISIYADLNIHCLWWKGPRAAFIPTPKWCLVSLYQIKYEITNAEVKLRTYGCMHLNFIFSGVTENGEEIFQVSSPCKYFYIYWPKENFKSSVPRYKNLFFIIILCPNIYFGSCAPKIFIMVFFCLHIFVFNLHAGVMNILLFTTYSLLFYLYVHFNWFTPIKKVS